VEVVCAIFHVWTLQKAKAANTERLKTAIDVRRQRIRHQADFGFLGFERPEMRSDRLQLLVCKLNLSAFASPSAPLEGNLSRSTDAGLRF